MPQGRHGVPWQHPRLPVAETTVPRSTRDKVVPVSVVDPVAARLFNTFFQNLPPRSLQFLTEAGETKVTASTLAVGNAITLFEVTVPDKTIWVLTDVQFYGLCPSAYLEAPMKALSAEQLSGLIRFELNLGERQPWQTHGAFVNTAAAASSVAAAGSGTPYVETAFDPPHTAFALYARSNQTVKVVANVDVAPRFWLSVLGARLTGFSLPELVFDNIFSRDDPG